MEPKLHEIDPKGDTLLILHNPDAPFAAQNSRFSVRGVRAAVKPEVRMRLSSRHLTLASAYFEKMLANDWKETTPEGDYSYVVKAEDWDEEALLIMMNIIHGRTAKLPMAMNLETLAKICALVDYYQCHEALKFFNQLWLGRIDRRSYTGRDLLLRLSVACVFPDRTKFQNLTMSLIKESKWPIESLGLPIPQSVIDALNKQREHYISAIITGLKELIKAECSDNGRKCSFECSSAFIGALIKGMDKARISEEYLSLPPYTGHSLESLQQVILGFAEPSWNKICVNRRNSMTYNSASFCTLANTTKPLVEGYINQVVGLVLRNYITHSV
ncbi:hypothetical protein BBK36DRAFT_1126953 [Trichoderma citrinoviride]|uniref:BTB domain-containing protein n=1 Tax=Trichoderma citrinoviride TaxID=58853 RepID=A0A2T4B2I1_9HYPO|nr:hypothetical protein BBK36DRAFT_1126953 [Trichoderma citrinoviride]PTB63510.1 hypothetical protein BBK36DRAFT_1126953 [Trichoderma citrinoviride]